MLLGVRVQVSPAGETVEVSSTVPVKPPVGATVMVDVPAAPARTLTLVGLAVTVKSPPATTTTVITMPWFFVPGVEVASVAVPFITTV